ncbi:MAG: hypothetical protein JSV64_02105, partial [Candidatus Bathyarchaeota archaeon]
KRTYMSYHQDGLVDIFVGVYVLLFALGILFSTVTDFSMWFMIPAIFPAVMLPIWMSVKKRITMPRIGYVRIGSRGVNKLMAVFIGLVVVGLGAFMVLTLASRSQAWALTLRDLIIPNGMIIMGIGAVIISGLFAYTMGLKRLFAYGLLTLALLLTSHYAIIPFAYSLLIIAFAITINGSILLVRFIRKHPLAQGDQANAEESL